MNKKQLSIFSRLLVLLSLICLSSCDTTSVDSSNTAANPPDGMVLIPLKGLSFTMGDSTAKDGEGIEHLVSFTYNIYMDTIEVTQKAFHNLMSDDAYGYEGYTKPLWNTYGVGDDYPAYNLNWFEAVLYCNARSKMSNLDTVYRYSSIIGIPGGYYPNPECKLADVHIDLTKKGFRLPNEAEWEYACRAGTTTRFYWGDNWNDDYFWYKWNSEITSHPVASKIPNEFGLYDMSGSVSEFCNDWHNIYTSDSVVDPVSLDSTRNYRIHRGGGWNSSSDLYSFSRDSYHPFYKSIERGFRCVLNQAIPESWK